MTTRRRTASDATTAAAAAFPFIPRLRVTPLLMYPLEGGPCRVFVAEVPFAATSAEAHRFGALAFSAMVDRHWEKPGGNVVLAFVLHEDRTVACSVLCGDSGPFHVSGRADVPPYLASTAATCEMVATLLTRADASDQRRVYVIGAEKSGAAGYTVSQCQSVMRLAKLSMFFRSVAPD